MCFNNNAIPSPISMLPASSFVTPAVPQFNSGLDERRQRRTQATESLRLTGILPRRGTAPNNNNNNNNNNNTYLPNGLTIQT